MEKYQLLVSLGREALGATPAKQWESKNKTAKALADLAGLSSHMAISYGAGMQVSMIHKAMTELRRIYIDYNPTPMCICSAMGQGYLGFDLQNALKSELLQRGISTPVASVLTQVVVDAYDEAFYAPSKPVGRFMSKEDAQLETSKGNHVQEFPGKGYRRIVAQPAPLEIVELDSIKLLFKAGQIVIAAGGGGIPVIEQQGQLKGASALIDKDAIAGKLAGDLAVDRLLILTDVDNVYLDYKGKSPKPLSQANIAQAKAWIQEGQFEAGTMLPKIQAAISYLERCPEGVAIITSPENATEALKGRAGTHFRAI